MWSASEKANVFRKYEKLLAELRKICTPRTIFSEIIYESLRYREEIEAIDTIILAPRRECQDLRMRFKGDY